MTDAEFRRRILGVVAARDDAREQACKERGEQITRIGAEVAVHLAHHPGATANAVSRHVAGRRQDILRAVRELRAAEKRYQSVGYHIGVGGLERLEDEEPL